MATIIVNNIISRAGVLLQDATNVRWPTDELLDWLNDGQREVVLLKPEACVKNEPLALDSGKTKQSLPAAGILVIDVVRNLGADGLTPGSAIRLVTREVLDSQRPTWHSDANATGDIKHFVYDQRDPKTFYVYPKAPATAWRVELVYSAAPTNATIGGVIQIDDIYGNALLDFILYKAYSKDASFAGNAQLAAAYYQTFAQSLGIKTANEASRNPYVAPNTASNPATK